MKTGTLRTVADTFFDAFIIRNIVLVQAIGLCPVIMAGTRLKYAVVLTVCTALVLVPSALVMSLFGNKMAAWLRPPVYTLCAAALLAAAGYVIERHISHVLFASMDVFIPLIAVNTLVSYRAGGFAVTNGPILALTDAAASSMGFGLVICIVSLLRELVSYGTIWDVAVDIPRLIPEAALPYAAFILMGFMAAFIQWIRTGFASISRKRSSGATEQAVAYGKSGV